MALLIIMPLHNSYAQGINVDESIEMMNGSKAVVADIFARLNAQGIPIPDTAQERYLEGLSIAEQAQRLREQGVGEEAKKNAFDAMNLFGDALDDVSIDDAISNEEKDAMRAAGLNAALERLQQRTQVAESIAKQAQGLGMSMQASELMDKANNVKSMVENIKQSVATNQLEDAEQEMEDVEDLLESLNEDEGSIVEEMKTRNAVEHLSMVEQRLDSIANMVTNLLDSLPVPPQAKIGLDIAKNAVSNALGNAKDRVSMVKQMLEEGRVDEAIEEFDDINEDIDETIDETKKQNSKAGQVVQELDILNQRLDTVEEKATILEAQGADVSELNSNIEQIEVLIDDIKQSFDSERFDSALDILDRANQLIDDTNELIEEVEASLFTITTDKQAYNAGESVEIVGTVPLTRSSQIAIQVFNPNGVLYTIDQLTPESNGVYTTTVVIGGNLGVDGTYIVKAAYSGLIIQTTFEFTGSESQ